MSSDIFVPGAVKAPENPVIETNYDEGKVPEYTLPDVLLCQDGGKVTNAVEWFSRRRLEVLDIFRKNMYGEMLPRPENMRTELLSEKADALGNTAIRREIRVHLEMNNGKKHFFDLLLYLPKNAQVPVPAFLGLNFKGNHVAANEKDVMMTGLKGQDMQFLTEEARGAQYHRWNFAEVVREGFATATVCYHDIFPDRKDGWEQSVYTLFGDGTGMSGTHEKFGAIGAWAWGLSRALDVLLAQPEIDPARVAVHGHSRLGKTSLWAGANDPRFAMVITNDSGCCGSAVSRRCFGETVEVITRRFPHWFCAGLLPYCNAENTMSFDQHFLMALIAPRPLAVASATEDLWADPKGEFLSAVHAGEVYRLFGETVLEADKMPPADTNLTGIVSYHLRTGQHDQTMQDWQHYIEIAQKYM